MKNLTPLALAASCLVSTVSAGPQVDVTPASAKKAAAADDLPLFEKPVRLEADGAFVCVEAPGYAAPCWTDVDGDGHFDLVVGQFAGGKMKVYRGDEKGRLAAGTWLEAGGQVAEVPGVW